MSTTSRLNQFWSIASVIIATSFGSSLAQADGEPAEAFLAHLRAVNYYDTAITYLDRIDEFPGVDPVLKQAVPLEKAQTLIAAAVSTRNAKDREQFFTDAEASLNVFLKQPKHPRAAEARGQLGKLQMVRATQLLTKEPDSAKRKQAHDAYLAAGKTFDAIVADLRIKIGDLRGIDKKKEPAKAKLRDQYQFEFLQAQVHAADTRKLAAKTFDKPATEGKALLEEALKRFEELSKKYSRYVQGAQASLYMGQIHELLGQKEKATERYLEMLDTLEADPLRESKYQAAAGLTGLRMAETPPKFQESINVCKPLIKDIRPNEKTLASVQELRLAAAKAYLAKSNDKDNQKPTDLKRAKSDGRTLLRDASKVPGPHLEETKELLAGLGIDQEDAQLPTAEPPKSLQAALDSARELLEASQNMEAAIAVLSEQDETPELKTEIEDLAKQLAETRSIGIQILRAGLGMANASTDIQLLNQTRQFLAFMLYQKKDARDAAVVGSFLARNAPGTEMGLKGGLMALSSLQMLLAEVPEDENDGLIAQVEKLADFLTKTWPDNPETAKAQGLRVRLLLQKDNFDSAKALINGMKSGGERAYFKRLLGQLLWNRSIQLRQAEKNEEADAAQIEAAQSLQEGLDGITGNLIAGEAMQAAVLLARIYHKQDKIDPAMAVLDHAKYGPIKLIETQDAPNPAFSGELYSTELKVLVAKMISVDDPATLLDRATQTMEKLRQANQGEEGQARLTQIFMRLARDVREQLDTATPVKKAKLIDVFKVFLKRIADTTKDTATLKWVGQTLMQMGESLMLPTDIKATGQAAELLTSSANTFKGLLGNDLSISYQYARANRLIGQYKTSLDELEKILKVNPMMLDAQFEAAQAYESWASEINPKFATKAFQAALSGGRKDANGKNVIWGWGEISQKTSRDKRFRAKFFDARYHVALTRFLMGTALKNKTMQEKAITDITKVAALYPDLGGKEQRDKYDVLLKQIQKTVGQKPVGLPAAKQPVAPAAKAPAADAPAA